MARIVGHLSVAELEARYRAARDVTEARHAQAIWLLAQGRTVLEVAEVLAFAPRWVTQLAARYDACGPAALGDSSLIARKVAEGRRVICAAPAYLDRRGRPAAPEDLLSHDCLVLRGLARLTSWPFRTPTGLQTLTVHGVATTDSAEALRDMALTGLGIIGVSAFIVARDIAEGRLIALFEDLHVSEDVPVWAVTAPGRHRLPRIQVFVDFLASHAADW